MSSFNFKCFVAIALVLGCAILAGTGKRQAGRWLLYGLTLILFVFAGLRSVAINSDTRSYADYSLHFQHAGVGEDPEIADRLEWGFRVFLRLLGLLLPESDSENYPHYVNLTVAILGWLLLHRALQGTREKMGALLLIYMSCLFFVHQFAIVRLGLATLLFLNYLIPAPRRRFFGFWPLVFLGAGCLLHYTILTMAIVLLAWEHILGLVSRPGFELAWFGLLVCLAVFFGTVAEHVAPLFLQGYHLMLVARNSELTISPKGALEVIFCVLIFLFHFKRIHWSWNRRHIRWRILFYMTLISFLVETTSGLPFIGRFRILAFGLFLMQTIVITNGIDFTKRTTWLLLFTALASIAAQIITISRDEGWFVLIGL